MVTWYLGTQGYSYPDWRGGFYPEQIAARNYLSHYSRYFNAVEMNTTFYGTPRPETVSSWAAVTPAGFKFCVKTPRVVTHEKGLVNAGEEMEAFINVIRHLGDKLGMILIQLPPSFDATNSDILENFLDVIPDDLDFAVEFRNRSWHKPETAKLLQEREVGWASTDYPRMPRRVELTTDMLYVRWMGPHARFKRYDHEQIDVTPQLTWWWETLQPYQERLYAIFGFFNDDYAGFAPGTCNRFKAIAGFPHQDLRPPQQGRLF
jgi:uncharacterized protein YecE (DUF72 family)